MEMVLFSRAVSSRPSDAEFGRQAVCGNSRHGARQSAIDADKVRAECLIRTLL